MVYFLMPYTALIQSPRLQFSALMVLLLIKGFAVIVGFPCITILLTNAAPSVRILGTLNGFATTFSGLGRAAGPMAAGATFSWGVERGYVLPAWWLLGVIAIGQIVPAWMIVEGDGPRREIESDDDEAVLFDDEAIEEHDEHEGNGLVAATTGGPPDTLIVETGRKGHGGHNEEDDDSDVGFAPLVRVSSKASGGYGTISQEVTRRRA